MKETLKKVIDDVRSEMPDNRFWKAVALTVLCLVFLIFGKVVFLIAAQKPLIFLLIVLIGGAVLGVNVLIKKSKKKMKRQ